MEHLSDRHVISFADIKKSLLIQNLRPSGDNNLHPLFFYAEFIGGLKQDRNADKLLAAILL
ncbi:MAG: hypothetical protein SRB2_02234 [Desulfobacteraceae bacterium Eth-SRB2]|nr:MAG: hypothetical protein SRB2_02234 [Desulfobacteraceae bacterium Eth-SRB2]